MLILGDSAAVRVEFRVEDEPLVVWLSLPLPPREEGVKECQEECLVGRLPLPEWVAVQGVAGGGAEEKEKAIGQVGAGFWCWVAAKVADEDASWGIWVGWVVEWEEGEVGVS